jgi:hypothetical protein
MKVPDRVSERSILRRLRRICTAPFRGWQIYVVTLLDFGMYRVQGNLSITHQQIHCHPQHNPPPLLLPPSVS